MNKSTLEKINDKITIDMNDYNARLGQLPASQVVMDAQNIGMAQYISNTIQTAIESAIEGTGYDYTPEELGVNAGWLKIDNIADAIVDSIYSGDIYLSLTRKDMVDFCRSIAEEKVPVKQQDRVD